jgi:hypothetical protein
MTNLSRSLLGLLILTFALLISAKQTDIDDPKSHYDLPVSDPTKSKENPMTLETVLLFSRHGNRAADPIVESLCPKRKKLTELYREQQASYGALTFNGIRAMWDLGRFTNYQYVQTGFIDGTYTRLTSQIRAAASDRTLISASAFGQTTFRNKYAESPLSIPVAVLTTTPEEDDLLEVRKARCAKRLEDDLHYFDQNIAQELIDNHSELINMISNACGFDILRGPELTNGEFSVMQLVKDLSDALTGDLLESFPLMDGVSVESRAAYLQFAEDVFKKRHYRTAEMDSYLAGNGPNRLIKLIDRRVSFNTNTTVLDSPLPRHLEIDDITYRDILVQDAKRLPIIRPRPPRRFFGYHAHREVLYGLKNFLKLDVGVERTGLPTGLIHPATGIFFELWKDDKQNDKLIKLAAKDEILPVLNPNRKNSLRYIANVVDDAYFLRILLWVPCFEGIEKDIYSGKDGKTPLKFLQKDPKTGEAMCLSRVRTLPQCDNLEFCPLTRVKQIIATNYNDANGDFRQHCPIDDEDSIYDNSAGFFGPRKEIVRPFRKFKTGIVEKKLRDFYNFDEDVNQEEKNTKFASLGQEFHDEIELALEEDSDSFDDYDSRIDGPVEGYRYKKKSKTFVPVKSVKDNHKTDFASPQTDSVSDNNKTYSVSDIKKTDSASMLSFGSGPEDVFNTQYQAPWANNLANIGLKKKKDIKE